MPYNPLDNFGDKLTQGRNTNTFSSENQPVGAGRKKVSDIKKLMKAMGKSLAPMELRKDAQISQFLVENNLKGTVNEVLLARLYALALYKENIKAMKLILDTINGRYGGSKYGVVINFISPPAEETTEDLTNDSWSLQTPGESKADK